MTTYLKQPLCVSSSAQLRSSRTSSERSAKDLFQSDMPCARVSSVYLPFSVCTRARLVALLASVVWRLRVSCVSLRRLDAGHGLPGYARSVTLRRVPCASADASRYFLPGRPSEISHHGLHSLLLTVSFPAKCGLLKAREVGGWWATAPVRGAFSLLYQLTEARRWSCNPRFRPTSRRRSSLIPSSAFTACESRFSLD